MEIWNIANEYILLNFIAWLQIMLNAALFGHEHRRELAGRKLARQCNSKEKYLIAQISQRKKRLRVIMYTITR